MKTQLMLSTIWLTGCAMQMSAGPALEPTRVEFAAAEGASQSEPPGEDASLEELLEAAVSRHPRLRAEHARWRAQVSRVRGVRHWQDPKVGYTFAPLPIETRLGPNRHTISVSQSVPWFSHHDRHVGVARARVRALARGFDASYVAVRLEVEELYWSIWALEQEAEVLGRKQRLLGALEASLRARVEIGSRPASQLSRVGLQRVRLADRVSQLEAARRVQEAALGRALGLSAPHGLTFPVDAATSAPPEVDLDAMLADAPAPPHLQALAEEIEARRAERELVGLEALPSFEVGAQWAIIDEGDSAAPDAGRDAVMMRVGISLPIWTGATDARIDAVDASVVEARARLEQERQRWVASLRATYVQAWDAHRRVQLIDATLLAQARGAHEMVQGDYEAERAEFSALLDAVDDIHDLELELARQRAARELHVSRWNALLGRPLVQTQETP